MLFWTKYFTYSMSKTIFKAWFLTIQYWAISVILFWWNSFWWTVYYAHRIVPSVSGPVSLHSVGVNAQNTTVMDERVTAMEADTITSEVSAVAEKVSLAPKEEWPVKYRQKHLKKSNLTMCLGLVEMYIYWSEPSRNYGFVLLSVWLRCYRKCEWCVICR